MRNAKHRSYATNRRADVIPNNSISLGPDRANDLAPLLGFASNMRTKLYGVERHRGGIRFPELGFYARVFQPRCDFAIESFNNLGSRALRRTNSVPRAHIVSRHSLTDSRHVRKRT